jgi:hypothetical protein
VKKKNLLMFSALAALALGAGCSPSSNPFAAPDLLSNIQATATPTRTAISTPTPTATSTATPCPYLGASGSPTGGGAVVSGASGSTTVNSYYSESFASSTSFTGLSFQAILANKGSAPETFFVGVYDSTNTLVSGSPATLVVPAGSGNFSYSWQKFDYTSGIPIASGSYTFIGYVTTGTDVSLGTINTSGNCQASGGLLSALSSFPNSISGLGSGSGGPCFGWLLSTCP